jgi:hypothetical protein
VLTCAEIEGAGDFRVCRTFRGVFQRQELRADFRQQTDTAVFDQHAQEVIGFRVDRFHQGLEGGDDIAGRRFRVAGNACTSGWAPIWASSATSSDHAARLNDSLPAWATRNRASA